MKNKEELGFPDALAQVIDAKIKEKGIPATTASLQSGFASNYLHKFIKREQRDITSRALFSIAQTLETNVGDLAFEAENLIRVSAEKKTAYLN